LGKFDGILGGALFGVAQAVSHGWLHPGFDRLALLRDITTGLIKSVMFGITITRWVSRGSVDTAGAEEVAAQRQERSDVDLLVVIVDLVFTEYSISWLAGKA